MRIAFIGQKGIPAITGGVERRVEELAVRMAEKGHDVFVYARRNYTNRKLKKYKGVHLINLPTIPTKNLDAIVHTFLATFHALFQNYDIINYQAPGPSTLSWIIKLLRPGITLVATFNSRDTEHQKWGWFARKYLKLGEYVICKVPDRTLTVSPVIQLYAKERYDADLTLIPNGAAFQHTSQKSVLKRWGLREKKYFLSVGRLIRHKGIHYLIEAFKKLEDTGKLPNSFKLVIAGEGSHTDEYVQYLKKISAGRENIIFTGNQNGGSLEQLFSHAYLFVQPSEAEGLSIALLEAMGCGVAPLVSDIEENLDPIEGVGFSFQSKNVESLEDKMAILVSNPELVLFTGKEAKKKMNREYSWDSIAQKYLDVYSETLMNKDNSNYVWKSRKV